MELTFLVGGRRVLEADQTLCVTDALLGAHGTQALGQGGRVQVSRAPSVCNHPQEVQDITTMLTYKGQLSSRSYTDGNYSFIVYHQGLL